MRPSLQLAVQSLTSIFCSWPPCRGSVDWFVIGGVLLGRWCHLLLYAWYFHSEWILWWFFFIWRSSWPSLQNSTSSPFLQGSRLGVLGCVPAASFPSCSSFHLVIVIDSDFVPVILYSLLLDILCNHWIPITFLSCLLLKLFMFLWSSFDTSQVLQLYNSILFTSVSYRRILIVSFVFQFFFQILSFFTRVIVANYFLLWISSQSPIFDPSFITFLHSISSSFDPIFTVVYSVFSSFTNRFLFFHYFFCFLIDLETFPVNFCEKGTVISIHYFLWDAAFHLFSQSWIHVSASHFLSDEELCWSTVWRVGHWYCFLEVIRC